MLDRISPLSAPWLILAASLATLGGAYFFQYALGYQPCHLCLWERIPYMIAIPAALGVIIITRATNFGLIPVALMALCALVFAANAGLSAYHAGAEYQWWPGPSSCTSGVSTIGSLAELQTQFESGIRPPRCDVAAWSLFGVSLAGINFLISLALFAIASLPLVRFEKDVHGIE